MKNRYLSESRKSATLNAIKASSNLNDDYYINTTKDLIIKLKYPNTQIKEIYDLDRLILDNNNNNNYNNSYLKNENARYYNRFNLNSRNSLTSNASSNSFSSSSSLLSGNSSPRSSIAAQSIRSENGSFTSNGCSNTFDDDEPFTFQDFVSSIINSENKENHVLIVHDIARLLELKFRDFKKSNQINASDILSSSHYNTNQQQQQQSKSNSTNIYLDSDSDLFTRIAECIFKLAIEEPNGILGARIKLKLMFSSGKVYDMCECFPYDSNTLATSEIIVTIKEDSKITAFKKFLLNFKFISTFGKYLCLNIDSKNFDIIKNRLY